MTPPAPPPDLPAPSRRAKWLAAAALVLAALAAYANSFTGPLVFDDIASIRENPSIRDLGRIGEVLSPPATDGMTVGGRPLLNLSLALNYAISGTDAWSYRALNLIIHILAGLTLFGIMRRTLALQPGLAAGTGQRGGVSPRLRNGIALSVAALWTLHPLQTESVTYVIQRAESLMGLLYLQTLYAFIRAAAAPDSRAWPAWCVGACLLGMATKEVMVSAPLLVLLYDRTFVSGTLREAWRRRPRLYAGLAASWVLLALLVASHGGSRGGSIGLGVQIGWWEHALTQFRAVTHYLRLSFWPAPLVFDYGPERARGVMDVLPYALVVGLLAWLTLRGLWRRTALGFAGVWFFAILAPTSLVPGPTQMTVEHRMYLPLAVVMAGAVVAALRVGRRRILVASLLVCAAFGGVTLARNADYRSELALWEDTARKRPENPVAVGSFAAALLQAGRLSEALALQQKAVALDPGYWDNWNNLGIALEKSGRLPEAAEAYAKALSIRPDRPIGHSHLARVLVALDRFEAAATQYQAALRLRPESAEDQAGLGTALMLLGRAPEAVGPLTSALRLGPGNAETEYNLGNALVASGRAVESVPHYESALRLRPTLAEAGCNLADVLFMLGRPADAVARYEAVLRARPDHAVAHARFGALLARLGRVSEARARLAEALRIDPNFSAAREALQGL